MEEWETYADRLYALERDGKLVGIHVGNRVWYSRAQLIELLGEPKHRPQPPASRRRENGDGVTGGEQQGFEFASSAKAA